MSVHTSRRLCASFIHSSAADCSQHPNFCAAENHGRQDRKPIASIYFNAKSDTWGRPAVYRALADAVRSRQELESKKREKLKPPATFAKSAPEIRTTSVNSSVHSWTSRSRFWEARLQYERCFENSSNKGRLVISSHHNSKEQQHQMQAHRTDTYPRE